ncbi:Capn9, partial [Symbiodinium sp. CCMP2456]
SSCPSGKYRSISDGMQSLVAGIHEFCEAMASWVLLWTRPRQATQATLDSPLLSLFDVSPLDHDVEAVRGTKEGARLLHEAWWRRLSGSSTRSATEHQGSEQLQCCTKSAPGASCAHPGKAVQRVAVRKSDPRAPGSHEALVLDADRPSAEKLLRLLKNKACVGSSSALRSGEQFFVRVWSAVPHPSMDESDNADNMTRGKYVYWMGQDEEIPRGELGEILRGSGDEGRKVKFANGERDIPTSELNVCNIQKGTFVHSVVGDYDWDVLGEVTGLQGGSLIIEVQEKTLSRKPMCVMRSDVQAGMFVHWTKSNEKIQRGVMGQVYEHLHYTGQVRVTFPRGTDAYPASELVRGPIQHKDYVQWRKENADIPKGQIGRVEFDYLKSREVKVRFAKGTYVFEVDDLFLHEMQMDSLVTWSKYSDDDVPKGEIGQVVGIRVSEGLLAVRFNQGTWGFKPNELNLHRIQPGNFVLWEKADEDILANEIGEVVRAVGGSNQLSVQWPTGFWPIRTKELKRLPFQRGDRVQWTKSGDHIPEGDWGIVLGVRTFKDENCDNNTTLWCKWTKGTFNISPQEMKRTHLSVESINHLKKSFQRFDANGDGKLTCEELTGVLCKLGGISEEDCQDLFANLDKDSDGKLTTNEFIDYVFAGGQATAAQRKLLAEGFGLEDAVGIEEDQNEEENDDDDDNPSDNNNIIVEPAPMVVTVDPDAGKDIGPETQVSRAEWASAMLVLGVCRQAALDSFESCASAAALERADGDISTLALENLAGELHGIGGAPGVEELRDAVGKVKTGAALAVDLDSPAEESDAERALAFKTGIDGLLYHLHVQNQPYESAAGELQKAKLSLLEALVLGSLDGDTLVEAVKAQAADPPVLSALSSWQRARENCKKEVESIIEACKAKGEKYTDESWNALEDPNSVMYVDKEKPGWDCMVGVPFGWKRAKEMRDYYELFHQGGSFQDIRQGQTGDCYLLGALASVAANRKAFLRQVFVAYDMEVGVYGLLFCEDSHYRHVIVDDVLGHDRSGRTPLYGSSTDWTEIWVSILEKAFFKHYTCIEMCDGGQGAEAIVSFLGGVTGRYGINYSEYNHPEDFFKRLVDAQKAGELMTSAFTKPSKGKYANMDGSSTGQCGERGLPFGLHAGHCYSLLRSVETGGHQLLCFRNPWAKGEWTGPWGDRSEEWTDEAREACDYAKKNDGLFWMAVQDYVQLSRYATFNRTFGPAWQTVKSYHRFGNGGRRARAKKDYQAQDNSEISFKRGDMLKDLEPRSQGTWCKGTLEKNGDRGYFKYGDVQQQSTDIFRFEFSVEGMADNAPVILSLMRENQKLCREWSKRKVDGLNYKDTRYSNGYWWIFHPDGRLFCKDRISYRHVWKFLPSHGGPWTIFINCSSGGGKRFSLQGFVPHGTMKIEKIDCSMEEFLNKCM